MTTNMTTSNPDTLWATHGSEECEEADEPPELPKRQPGSDKFQKTAIRRPSVNASLLTKAIMGQSDDDLAHEVPHTTMSNVERRRSLASNISLASTADLTSDTGLTSPSRPNTPSPPLPEMAMLRLDRNTPTDPKHVSLLGAAVKLQSQLQPPVEAPRKRIIQFACGGKPPVQETHLRAQPMVKTPSAQEAPRRSCIKFACPARPASTQNTPPQRIPSHMGQAARNAKPESPSTPKRISEISAATTATPRQTTPRQPSGSRPKFLRANSKDLTNDGSHFHEFASGIAREDDWIRRENSGVGKKLTINDTLTKENHIRRLATEAEEEAEAEEEEDDEINNDEDDEDAVDDEDDLDNALGDMDEEDEDEDEDEEDDDSDGYHTDEETGFAESDDDDDDDDNMRLWNPSQQTVIPIGSSAPTARRLSVTEQSDSSITTQNSRSNTRRERIKRTKRREEALDLPDSTDFVCGTLDEDRPLEEAYLSCLAARRNGKLRLIPQDIDPSFPASEPEDDNEGEIFNPVHHESDDEDEWLHGKMEDIHHDRDRSRRRRKSNVSPKRYRSPPPKRHHSPPPKNRGRSPKPLFDRLSPRKGRSPARAKPMTTPLGSPRCGQVNFNLAGRPGLTHTKSLPRAGAVFFKHGRHHKAIQDQDVHLRGAIDIVKGLESKRQRRKEKFFQKYCNRARRGQIPERRPQPGRGAERMKELGLLMAGKKDQGNYVLSV